MVQFFSSEGSSGERDLSLQFPNAVVLNAAGRRNTQIRSEDCGCLEEGCLGLRGVSQTFLELQVSLGNEGKDGENLNSSLGLELPDVLLPDIRDHPMRAKERR